MVTYEVYRSPTLILFNVRDIRQEDEDTVWTVERHFYVEIHNRQDII